MIQTGTFPPIEGYPCTVSGCDYVGMGKMGYLKLDHHMKQMHNNTPYPIMTEYFAQMCGYNYKLKWEKNIKREEEHRYRAEQMKSYTFEPNHVAYNLVFPLPNCPSTFESQDKLRKHYSTHKKNLSAARINVNWYSPFLFILKAYCTNNHHGFTFRDIIHKEHCFRCTYHTKSHNFDSRRSKDNTVNGSVVTFL
jgi:hypothetical protein